jgi:hypothetical protein
MHLEGNTSKWWHAYKQNHPMLNWKQLCEVIQEQFSADDYHNAINDLLALR